MKFADVKEGDVLIADGGFSCIREGARVTVKEGPENGLYVPCGRGKHYLDGQIDFDNGDIIGFRRV